MGLMGHGADGAWAKLMGSMVLMGQDEDGSYEAQWGQPQAHRAGALTWAGGGHPQVGQLEHGVGKLLQGRRGGAGWGHRGRGGQGGGMHGTVRLMLPSPPLSVSHSWQHRARSGQQGYKKSQDRQAQAGAHRGSLLLIYSCTCTLAYSTPNLF